MALIERSRWNLNTALMVFMTAAVAPAQTPPTSTPSAQTQPQTLSPYRYFLPAQRENQKSFEREINAVPAGKSLRTWHDLLASEPHLAGSPGDARLIKRMADEFAAMGLEVQVHEFWPYLCKPIAAKLEIIDDVPISLPLRERELPEDAYSGNSEETFGFNAFSGSGEVTAEVIYANYGTKADYEKLKSIGIDCSGKIVIARYGGNFRGYKAKFAEAQGAVGLIIFSDPDDVGYRQGVTYPEGGWANDSYIQRGSLLTLDYPGDPLSPGIAATENAKRLNPAEVALPHIPVQPIGYGAAGEIFKRMKGMPLPREWVKTWQGGLPCAYRLDSGPDMKVRLMVKQERAIQKTANVIATLRGSEFPDQKIIIGCHHDAWCCGAGDPTSGTILVFEAAKCFAEAAKQGLRPKRSIVFCCWGAEEYGIMGSTEFCEQNADDLRANAIAYVNLDAATMGTKFGSSAAPTLKTLIEEITRAVPQPTGSKEQVVHQGWLGDSDEPKFGNLGGGSDHIGFYCHLGIPSCAFGAEGAPGTAYHSIYDNLHWYRQVVGEDYEPAVMLTRIVNLFAARMANAVVLPVDCSRYGPDSRQHLEALASRAKELGVQVNFSEVIGEIDRFDSLAIQFNRTAMALVEKEGLTVDLAEQINRDVIRGCDLLWLDDDSGLRGRPWFKNLYAASDPDSGYAAWMFPDLRLAIEQKDPGQVEQATKRLLRVWQRLNATMQQGLDSINRDSNTGVEQHP